MKIDFTVLQYTIDDRPAYKLALSYESNWCDLTAQNGIIQIPHFYNSGNSRKILEVLGFDSNEELEHFIQEKHIDRIKPESIKEPIFI